MASIAEEQNLMDSVKSVHSCMAQTIARTSLYSGFVKSSNVLVGYVYIESQWIVVLIYLSI